MSRDVAALSLPATLPVFPLSSALLLPGGALPLNIFERRYRAMVEHALAGDRLIGIVHTESGVGNPADVSAPPLMPLGCAGLIETCERLPDERSALVLRGVSRFRLGQELPQHAGGFRQCVVDWSLLADDMPTMADADFPMPREALVEAAESLLPENARLDRDAVASLTNADLLRALAMQLPLSVWDMQAVLEAPDGTARADALLAALECALAIRHSAHASTQRH